MSTVTLILQSSANREIIHFRLRKYLKSLFLNQLSAVFFLQMDTFLFFLTRDQKNYFFMTSYRERIFRLVKLLKEKTI